MSDQVVISKNNGQLAIAIPLFRFHWEEKLANLDGYSVSLTNGQPLAYVIDCGPGMGQPQVMGAKFVETQLEFLGDL